MTTEIIEAKAKPIARPAFTKKKEFDIDAYISKRTEFITKVNTIMVEGKDYHIIQGKKSMAKGGAEKIANIFGWTAGFTKDEDAMGAFSTIPGIICFVCMLSKTGKQIGEGRGAAILSKNSNDPNKTLKMAQKSAFIDAVIRASGLSDFYTQDLEDMAPEDFKGHLEPIKPSDSQKKVIWGTMQKKDYTEADLIDQGFPPLKQLTGGRDGTASELIDWLFKAPTNGQTRPRNITPEQDLSTIQVESSLEAQRIADEIDY